MGHDKGASITLKQTYHSKISLAIDGFRKKIKGECGNLYFNLNRHVFWVSGIVTLLAFGAIIWGADDQGLAVFMTVWLSGWLVGTSALVYTAITNWRSALSTGGAAFLPAIGISLFALPFVGGAVFGLFMMGMALICILKMGN